MCTYVWSVYVVTRGPGPSRSRTVLTCEIRRSSEPGLLACQGNIILGDDAYTPHEEAISTREARVGQGRRERRDSRGEARVRRKDEAEGGEYTGGEREQGGIQAPKV